MPNVSLSTLTANAIYGTFAKAKSFLSPGGEKIIKPEIDQAVAIAEADGEVTDREKHAIAYNTSFGLFKGADSEQRYPMSRGALKAVKDFFKTYGQVSYPVDDSMFERAEKRKPAQPKEPPARVLP